MIKDYKDENNHLRSELANLRKSVKSQQIDKTQVGKQEKKVSFVFF